MEPLTSASPVSCSCKGTAHSCWMAATGVPAVVLTPGRLFPTSRGDVPISGMAGNLAKGASGTMLMSSLARCPCQIERASKVSRRVDDRMWSASAQDMMEGLLDRPQKDRGFPASTSVGPIWVSQRRL
ncbi:hypothetical protein MRX96_024797 [Rhipicephalus microplus]